jgi:hypothetical protein
MEKQRHYPYNSQYGNVSVENEYGEWPIIGSESVLKKATVKHVTQGVRLLLHCLMLSQILVQPSAVSVLAVLRTVFDFSEVRC